MDDAALKAANEKIAGLQNEMAELRNSISDRQSRLTRLEKEVADLTGWIEMWHRLAGTEAPSTAAERIEKVEDTKPKRPDNPPKEFVADQAVEIIRERGEPMSRRDLFNALRERGVIIQGKDPEMVLSTMLWRMNDRIVRLPPYGYWPADEEYERAFYVPSIDDLIGAAAKEPEDGMEADDAD